MCRPVACTTCGKTTWDGCGNHIDEVKASVPAEQWCPGHGAADGALPSGNDSGAKGVFARLFGR